MYTPDLFNYFKMLDQLSKSKRSADSDAFESYLNYLIDLTGQSLDAYAQMIQILYPEMAQEISKSLEASRAIGKAYGEALSDELNETVETTSEILQEMANNKSLQKKVKFNLELIDKSLELEKDLIKSVVKDLSKAFDKEFKEIMKNPKYNEFLSRSSKPLFEDVFTSPENDAEEATPDENAKMMESIIHDGLTTLGINNKDADAMISDAEKTVEEIKKGPKDLSPEERKAWQKTYENYEDALTSWIAAYRSLLQGLTA